MRAMPDGFEVSVLVDALAEGWGADVATADYAAVGGGSYHWIVRGVDGRQRFVTVDDLDQKPWLGDSRDTVFAGLRRAFDTAGALHDAGLGFVVAPTRTDRGETVRRIGPRHAIALFPFMDGHAGRFGHYDDSERVVVVDMLADLHRATPVVASLARQIGLEVPGRRHIEAGLLELDEAWSGGPFAEPARQALAAHAADVAELLALADRLAADVASRGDQWVVTHGEPHAANVISTRERRVLIDWDTVGLAPPERDLWMVLDRGTEEAARMYSNATGRAIDRVALDLYRLAWDLDDLAAYLSELRSPHHRSADTENAYLGVTRCVASRDRWTALLG